MSTSTLEHFKGSINLSTPAPFADYQCCTEGSSFASRNSEPFTLDSVSVIK